MTDADRLVAAEAARDARPQKVGEEMPEDESRVEPSVPCVAGQGSTAERPPGEVTAAKLTNIRKRLRAISDPPWEVFRAEEIAIMTRDGAMVVDQVYGEADDEADQRDADAVFIAHAPDDIAHLIAALEEAEAASARLRAACRKYLDNHCANSDAEGMSALCECKLCLDTRELLAGDVPLRPSRQDGEM